MITRENPYSEAVVITPNDATNINPTAALLVGVGGTVTVDMFKTGTNVALKLAAGIHKLTVKRVYSTGTTATDLVALY